MLYGMLNRRPHLDVLPFWGAKVPGFGRHLLKKCVPADVGPKKVVEEKGGSFMIFFLLQVFGGLVQYYNIAEGCFDFESYILFFVYVFLWHKVT